MQFDAGSGFDVSPWDVRIIGYLPGLRLYKCVNWEEGPSHGGDIGTTEVGTLFDYITEAQDIAGYTDYRKVHVKNTAPTATGQCYIRPILQVPDSLEPRLTVTVASGYDYDDMTNKPSDGSFSSVMPASIDADGYSPMWVKRTILAAGAEREYYTNLALYFSVSTA